MIGKAWKYVAAGWHVLAEIHTAIWVLGLFGFASSSVVQVWLALSNTKLLALVLLAQTLIWGLMSLLAVGYVGYRVKRNALKRQGRPLQGGIGGAGGSGTIVGNRGTVIGGKGGNAGVGGIGGHGGGGVIEGDDGLIVGGDGGSAGTSDGRGGRGARGPMESMGGPTASWPYGRGGAGANHPEYNKRISLLAEIRNEYKTIFQNEVPFIEAGIDPVPIAWINKRLEERGESWRVEMSNGGYILPPL